MPKFDKFDFQYSTAMTAKLRLCVVLETELKIINEDYEKLR